MFFASSYSGPLSKSFSSVSFRKRLGSTAVPIEPVAKVFALTASGCVQGVWLRRIKRRKCLFCGGLFRPDPRSRDREKYCGEAACRTPSKAASQSRWLAKSENAGYFSGTRHCRASRPSSISHPGWACVRERRSPRGRCSPRPANVLRIDWHKHCGWLQLPCAIASPHWVRASVAWLQSWTSLRRSAPRRISWHVWCMPC